MASTLKGGRIAMHGLIAWTDGPLGPIVGAVLLILLIVVYIAVSESCAAFFRWASLRLTSDRRLFAEYNSAGWRLVMICYATLFQDLMDPNGSFITWIRLESEWLRRGYAPLEIWDFTDPQIRLPINRMRKRRHRESIRHPAALAYKEAKADLARRIAAKQAVRA